MYYCLCDSVNCSMMLRTVKIWSVQTRPFRKPSCSCLSRWSTASEKMSLARILLGTDRGMITLQLLQLLRAPFVGIFTMTPSVQSSGSFISSHVAAMSGWRVCKLWLCLEELCVEAVLSRGFLFFKDLRLLLFLLSLVVRCWHLGQYQDDVFLLQLLVVVCSERRWKDCPSCLQPSLFIQNRCVNGSVVLTAYDLGNFVHLSLFSFVGGLFCLTCQVFHLARPACLPFSSSLLSCLLLGTVYCCLYFSLSLSDLLSMTFFFKGFLLSMAS